MAKKSKPLYNDYGKYLDNNKQNVRIRTDSPLMCGICFLLSVAVLICMFVPVATVSVGVKEEYAQALEKFLGSDSETSTIGTLNLEYRMNMYTMLDMYLSDAKGEEPSNSGDVGTGDVSLIGELWTYVTSNGLTVLFDGIQTSDSQGKVETVKSILPIIIVIGAVILIAALILFALSMCAVVGLKRLIPVIQIVSGVLAVASVAWLVFACFMNLPYLHFYYIAYISMKMGAATILTCLFAVTSFVCSLTVKK
ncbi:MAG: hypothetical protein PHX51_04910 [Clostridia bacterium]|nr:hypothetical protein [Clostridia bacterium]